MKIIGAGLSRTGTTSLHKALQVLGYKSLHYDKVRLNDILDGSNANPDFRRYDDVDAVTDIPSAYFYKELSKVYSGSKVVLTIRDVESWWQSFSYHCYVRNPIPKRTIISRLARKTGIKRWPGRLQDERIRYRINLMTYVYGAVFPREFLSKKRYIEHNLLVQKTVAPENLLVMDIAAGDGWTKLCSFLGKDIPSESFPHANQTIG